MNPATSQFPQAEFRAGVTACLRSWSAFRTAVEGGWGGNDSIAKADDLRENIYRFMTGQTATPSLELEDLEDNLIIYLEEEFSVTLEDTSEKQVATTLFQLYAECIQGKTALAESLVQTALAYDQQIAAAYPVCVQSTEHDDDDDDDAMMDTGGGPSNNVSIVAQQPVVTTPVINPAEYAGQSLFGKTKKPKAPRQPKEEPEMQMDDEGFATVTKSRRKPRP